MLRLVTYSHRSRTYTVTVEPGVKSGAALFPAAPLQLELMTRKNKDTLRMFMDDNVRSRPFPGRLTREDFLLAHTGSRVITAECVMVRFEMLRVSLNVMPQTFEVSIGPNWEVQITPARIFQHEPAVEHGVEISALPRPPKEPRKLESKTLGCFN